MYHAMGIMARDVLPARDLVVNKVVVPGLTRTGTRCFVLQKLLALAFKK